MKCFEGDITKDELCKIIIEALRPGPKKSGELRSICKDRYASSLLTGKYALRVMVSDSEIYYRIKRLLREGLIRRDRSEYALLKK